MGEGYGYFKAANTYHTATYAHNPTTLKENQYYRTGSA
jgi:hypothetical protein